MRARRPTVMLAALRGGTDKREEIAMGHGKSGSGKMNFNGKEDQETAEDAFFEEAVEDD